eukprot:scaffold50453_cov40-Phaeocystis_antarctica.AAC.1
MSSRTRSTIDCPYPTALYCSPLTTYESPGGDANDLPMYEYHEQFCAEIRSLLTFQVRVRVRVRVRAGDRG